MFKIIVHNKYNIETSETVGNRINQREKKNSAEKSPGPDNKAKKKNKIK